MHLRVRSSATPGTVRFDVDRSTLDRLRDLVAQSTEHEVEAVVGDGRFIIDHSVIAFLRHQMARACDYGDTMPPDLLVTLFTIGHRSTLRAEPIAVAMSEGFGPDEAVGHTSPAAVGRPAAWRGAVGA
jgi:hypothetical protein